jgi:hypothetical protein
VLSQTSSAGGMTLPKGLRQQVRKADNSAKWWELIYVCPGLYRCNAARGHLGFPPRRPFATTALQPLFSSKRLRPDAGKRVEAGTYAWVELVLKQNLDL